MRRSFPWFWIFQFFAFVLFGALSLFHPMGLLDFFRGSQSPKQVERPREALISWVLGIEEVDPPNERVREFFAEHDARAKEKHVWSPDDPSLTQYTSKSDDSGWQEPETHNQAWEEVELWLLSCRPPPPAEDLERIQNWLHAIDQIPEPSHEFRHWVATIGKPSPPPKELRAMILEGQQVLPISWQMASQQIRFTSPCVFAAAFFTLLGILTPQIRRPLARVFVLVFIFWSVSQFGNTFGPDTDFVSQTILLLGLCLGVSIVVRIVKTSTTTMAASYTLFVVISLWWIAVLFASIIGDDSDSTKWVARVNLVLATSAVVIGGITNAWYWLIGRDEDPPQDNGGIVQRRPPQLWTLWIVQFAVLFLTGFVAMSVPEKIAELFIRDEFDHLSIEVVDDSVKSLGAWTISMALFSFFALGVGSDWVWQGISLVFCVVFGLLAASTVEIASTGTYSEWIYVYGFQGVVFIPVTLVLLRRRDPYANANVERFSALDWCGTDLLLLPFLIWRPFFRGERPYFRYGVGASGMLRVLHPPDDVVDPKLRPPASNYFVPGREFPVEARFSNFSQEDDASLDFRGCALRIGAGASDRLDMYFQTGEFSPYAKLGDVFRFLRTRNLQSLVSENLILREGMAAGMRRAPSSYADLSYYDHFVLEWTTPSSEWYLVRFRLAPVPASSDERASDAVRQGVPDQKDLCALWWQGRRPDETRDVDYLRRELHERLERGEKVVFRLEVQFHYPHPGDTEDWYDPSIEWETRQCPWLPIAEMTLDTPMTVEESDRRIFDPSRIPLCLSVPRPDRVMDVGDPRALCSARFRLARFAGGVRAWRRRLNAAIAKRKMGDVTATTKID